MPGAALMLWDPEYTTISIEEPTQGDDPHPERIGLVARIRAGHKKTVVELEEIFRGGIRSVLYRALGQYELENRQREALCLVIERIKNTSIDHPNRLDSCVFTALRQYIDSQLELDRA
jgi:hypothetical protein